MAILTPISVGEARTFLSNYEDMGEVVTVRGIPLGTVNSSFAVELATGGRLFLRVYEEQDRAGAKAEGELLLHLAAKGVPTPAPLRRKDGGTIGGHAGKPAALFPWRDGHMRCLSSVSAEDARRVGVALARIHKAGEGFAVRPGRFRLEDLEARLSRIQRFPDRAIADLAGPLRAKLDAVARALDPSMPRGLTHGDLFRDNVLWDPRGEIAALLDFESASLGTFGFDLMVTILAWCFVAGFDAARARAMAAGYAAERPLVELELRGLHAEARLAALRFTITRITDDAMRAAELGVPPRRDKDWRRFAARTAELEAMGSEGLLRLLGLSSPDAA
jgi:homoserine kinase type II